MLDTNASNRLEEDSDDVLDLGITDALDDLVTDDDSINLKNRRFQKDNANSRIHNVLVSKEVNITVPKKKKYTLHTNLLAKSSESVSIKINEKRKSEVDEYDCLGNVELNFQCDLREKLREKSSNFRGSIENNLLPKNYKDEGKNISRKKHPKTEKIILVNERNYENNRYWENVNTFDQRRESCGSYNEIRKERDEVEHLNRSAHMLSEPRIEVLHTIHPSFR